MNKTAIARIGDTNRALTSLNDYIRSNTSSEIPVISKDQTVKIPKGIDRMFIMKGTGYVRKKEKI